MVLHDSQSGFQKTPTREGEHPMGWFGWSNSKDRSGLNTGKKTGTDAKSGTGYVKSQTLKGNDRSHDHSFVTHTTNPSTGKVTTSMGSSSKGGGAAAAKSGGGKK